ncbi:hypothetical protein FHR81_003222 [Actinoalloteichus hoggarensis]|uniref:Uncharacterized protein n=1 Tax=Actinoalloteichus hoggarensis TaxID=1470176 RepID=A0A221W6Q6_9PSEU|nr:hypothetical protein [Actinoalloteichus hoggarensis]ASO21578.1 hypothetical protein AHOG_19800 [Actinoalloteichus hoggarensis]MBB5922170.1 hypothetical protein [Actinoalloteichus hoggarensis]
MSVVELRNDLAGLMEILDAFPANRLTYAASTADSTLQRVLASSAAVSADQAYRRSAAARRDVDRSAQDIQDCHRALHEYMKVL